MNSIATDAAFQSDLFIAREPTATNIIQQLLAVDAHSRRVRSIIVEGVLGRGKSWLLAHIAQRLRAREDDILLTNRHNAPVIFAYKWPSKQRPENGQSTWNAFLVEQVAQICSVLSQDLRFETSTWPLNLIATQGIARQQEWEAALSVYSMDSVVAALASLIQRSGVPCLLIIDDIDILQPDQLRKFEDALLVPLFMSPLVRLLASRVTESNAHTWRSYTIRSQMKVEKLPGLGEGLSAVLLPDDADDPRLKQIDNILQAKLGLNVAIQWRKQLLVEGAKSYSWSNPGLNRFLIEQALHYEKPIVLGTDLLKYLRYWLEQPRKEEAPERKSRSTDEIIAWLRHIIDREGQHLITGVQRSQLGIQPPMSDWERDGLLQWLQSCGVGTFRRDGTYQFIPEIVELVGWMNRL